MIITIIAGAVSIRPFWNQPIVEPKEPKEKSALLVSVSGALYAVIAGFAIKNATEFVLNHFIDSKLMLDSSKDYFMRIFDALWITPEAKMGIIFLIMAIPFYHGAMIFLSDKSRKEDEGAKGLTWHFGILFIQAIIFLSVSFALKSFEFVVVLLIFLMLIDSIWIIGGQKTKNKPPIGWLSLNLCFTGALFLSLYNISVIDSLNLLFLSTLFRTAVDYVGFKNIYM